jgi:hypothetical protein
MGSTKTIGNHGDGFSDDKLEINFTLNEIRELGPEIGGILLNYSAVRLLASSNDHFIAPAEPFHFFIFADNFLSPQQAFYHAEQVAGGQLVG